MFGVLYQYLSADHDSLDQLLDRAMSKPSVIDFESYSHFRKRLLRHISIEEKIVLPAITKWQHGRKPALADQLHPDHAAIVSLLVPPPSPSIILTLKSVFAVHNPLEENAGGLYDVFETLAGSTDSRTGWSAHVTKDTFRWTTVPFCKGLHHVHSLASQFNDKETTLLRRELSYDAARWPDGNGRGNRN